MQFKMIHCNLNVCDLEKSITFYKNALGLHVASQKKAEDGSFILCYLQDQTSTFELELTWLKEHPEAYDLGENENHLAFQTDDFEEAHAVHEKLGCICFENKEMGIYFINDPDGYWLEILPV